MPPGRPEQVLSGSRQGGLTVPQPLHQAAGPLRVSHVPQNPSGQAGADLGKAIPERLRSRRAWRRCF